MYRLIIQPFDSSYDFLEDIIANAKSIYKIRVAEIVEERRLPEKILLKPKSMLAKFFMKDRRMVYLNDLMGELKRLFCTSPKTILLAILPHYILGLGEGFVGLTPEQNISIVSTYNIDKKHLFRACVGISLHEIGHNIGLRHCNVKGCLMKAPCKPENFYKGVYMLCEKHQLEVKETISLNV
jgi:predicted Zn-dependent protease